MYWHKSNYEDIKLGKTAQWKWYTMSFATYPSFNITLYCYFGGIAFHFHDLYLLPTIHFNLIHDWKRFSEHFISFQWLNMCLNINYPHFFRFKGKRTLKEVNEYLKFKQMTMEDIVDNTLNE